MDAELIISEKQYADIQHHLIRGRSKAEEAAFGYLTSIGNARFEMRHWEPVPEAGFLYKSLYGLELTDEYRAKVIKQAHDLGTAIMEFHSHPASAGAAFSPSDRAGFRDFVPHVRWRLKQKPYFAAVFATREFDSLWWFSDNQAPDGVISLRVDGRAIEPSRATLDEWGDRPDDDAI